ncbi:MAG: SDR family NAD(P)-dependent oxidoreductase [Kiritimatiellia bacterium]|jgi:short-subunit dehydrogenase
MTFDYDNVLITGASSGIGEALAIGFAQRGARNLFLGGRDADRLASVAAACEAAGATVHPRTVDVADADAMRTWILEANANAPLDLVVANAGIGTTDETEPNIRRMFATNVGGVLNTVFPAIDIFSDTDAGTDTTRRRQIAITSSLTGYHGMSTCPAYSASKACVKAWGAGLRGSLAPQGIQVNVICPGFVRSRITDRNTCPMPFFMEADEAADIIISRLSRNIGLITFPWPMRLAMGFISSLPERLSAWILSRLPQKA